METLKDFEDWLKSVGFAKQKSNFIEPVTDWPSWEHELWKHDSFNAYLLTVPHRTEPKVALGSTVGLISLVGEPMDFQEAVDFIRDCMLSEVLKIKGKL